VYSIVLSCLRPSPLSSFHARLDMNAMSWRSKETTKVATRINNVQQLARLRRRRSSAFHLRQALLEEGSITLKKDTREISLKDLEIFDFSDILHILDLSENDGAHMQRRHSELLELLGEVASGFYPKLKELRISCVVLHVRQAAQAGRRPSPPCGDRVPAPPRTAPASVPCIRRGEFLDYLPDPEEAHQATLFAKVLDVLKNYTIEVLVLRCGAVGGPQRRGRVTWRQEREDESARTPVHTPSDVPTVLLPLRARHWTLTDAQQDQLTAVLPQLLAKQHAPRSAVDAVAAAGSLAQATKKSLRKLHLMCARAATLSSRRQPGCRERARRSAVGR